MKCRIELKVINDAPTHIVIDEETESVNNGIGFVDFPDLFNNEFFWALDLNATSGIDGRPWTQIKFPSLPALLKYLEEMPNPS